jgi:transcriptional regulator with XRE-family HTH domain
MGRTRTGPGRPRTRENILSRWLDSAGISRDTFAVKLGVTRTHLDRLCRADRRPGLDLALLIERLSKGAVPVSAWKNVPPHSAD